MDTTMFTLILAMTMMLASTAAKEQNFTTDPPSLINHTVEPTTHGDREHAYHFYFILTTVSISSLAFIINFLGMMRMCCINEYMKVIELFGAGLMLFNLILSAYGMAIGFYLNFHDVNVWKSKFCQGFTSLKLFSMGINVWMLILLSFHFTVTGNGKNVARDALFKGIVYILEGLMLSGVFAVLAWIKLDTWRYACIIWEPKTTVDWLLFGIEMLYYSVLLLLILRIPYHFYKKRKNPKSYSSFPNEVPIFVIVVITCIIWIIGYLVTAPIFSLFRFTFIAVIRTCVLIIPIIFQPLIFIVRNAWICKGKRPCYGKNKDDLEFELACECMGSETCPACDPEFEPLVSPNQRVIDKSVLGDEKPKSRFQRSKDILLRSKRRNKAQSSQTNYSESESLVENKKTLETKVPSETEILPSVSVTTAEKVDKTKLTLDLENCAPVADLERSPLNVPIKPSHNQSEVPSFINPNDAREFEKLALLNKEAEKLNTPKENNEEGRISRGPTFYPMVDKKVKKRRKSTESKKTPIKEEKPFTPTKKSDFSYTSLDKGSNGHAYLSMGDNESATENGEKLFNEGQENDKNQQNNLEKNEKSIKRNNKKDTKSSHKDAKRKRKNSKVKNSGNDISSSTLSLEWDHFSDSSSSQESYSKNCDYLINTEGQLRKSLELLEEQAAAKSEPNAMEWDHTDIEVTKNRELKTESSLDWEPYSVDEASSGTGSSVNKSPDSLNSNNLNDMADNKKSKKSDVEPLLAHNSEPK